GLPDALHVALVSATGVAGISVAAPRTSGRVLDAWRAVGVSLGAGALIFLHSDGAVRVAGETWEVPAVYGVLLAAVAFDGGFRRYLPSLLTLPALASAPCASVIWYQEWAGVHQAWAPVTFGAAMAFGQPWAHRLQRPLIDRGLPAYALALTAVPLGFVTWYLALPFAGAAVFAASAGAWGVLAYRRTKPISWLFGADDRHSAEPSAMALGAFAFAMMAVGYFNYGLELSPEDGAWIAAILAFGALAVPLVRSERATGWTNESLVAGLGALAIVTSASFSRDWQVALFLGAGAALLGATSFQLRRTGLAVLAVPLGVLALLAAWSEAGWPTWSLSLTLAGAGAVTYAGLYRARDGAGYAKETSQLVTLSVPVSAILLAAFSLAARTFDLATGEDLVTSTEWIVLAATLAVGAALLTGEGVLRRQRTLVYWGAAVLVGSVELAVASLEPTNVQAFTIPVGLYLLALGFLVRRATPFFGRHMYSNEALLALASLVFVLPPAQQSLTPGGEAWGLMVIAMALGLLVLGLAFAQRWLTVAGVVTVAAAGGRFAFATGASAIPNWVIIGVVGLALLGLGTLLLFEREWWERTRSKLSGWWLPEDEVTPLPPPPAPGAEPLDVAG
ncbi:MAG TPA: hypothetical protein PKD27_04605, partial [Tepidiformaceae bacterium]|nr:hypothetical protein [Tepidiformaceae bacterium]